MEGWMHGCIVGMYIGGRSKGSPGKGIQKSNVCGKSLFMIGVLGTEAMHLVNAIPMEKELAPGIRRVPY